MYEKSKLKLEKMIADADVIQVSEYQHANSKIKWKCKLDHEFERSYSSACQHGLKCPTSNLKLKQKTSTTQ